MEDRDKLLWRPNDNSVKTNLRYDLEAKHWLRSIDNATPSPTPTFGQVAGFLGLLLSFIFNLIHLIILIVVDAIKWVVKKFPKKKDKFDDIPTFANKPKLSYEEMCQIQKDAEESGVVITVE